MKIILDEPFGQFLVKESDVVRHISKRNKLLLKRSIEPFVHGVVLGRMHARNVMRDTHGIAGLVEGSSELAAVVRLDVLDFSLKQEMETSEEIFR